LISSSSRSVSAIQTLPFFRSLISIGCFVMINCAYRIMAMVVCSHALRLLSTKNLSNEDTTSFYMEHSKKCPPWSQCPETYVDHEDTSLSFEKSMLPIKKTQMLMAVFTGADFVDRRQAVRGVWNSPRNSIQDTDGLLRKFVVCSNSHVLEHLRREADNYKDILFLECEEGYTKAYLTKKTASLMKYFVDNFSEGSILFKTDDDTYVDERKLLKKAATKFQISDHYVFAGLIYGVTRPIRNQSDPWYEPLSVWDEDYPPSMAGGPGYLLSYNLAQEILEQKLPERYCLYNEDRAVGVWVKEIQKRVHVNWIPMSATDGYNLDLCKFMQFKFKHGWKSYPFIMQHHLSPDHITCFSYQELEPSCFC